MRHSDVIYLLIPEVIEDDLGQKVPTDNYAERMIFANKYSVGAAEFYEAANSGMKPEKQFEIYSFEYNDESLLKHEDKIYSIIRVQEAGEKTRITCERDVGNG
jgi:SPP1 family predicted phage head-tail adaptor